MILNLQNPLPLLCSSGTLTAAATLQNAQTNVLGYTRIVGNIFSSVAPAGGFPKILFSADGVTTDYTIAVSQDTSKTNFNYSIDVPITSPYVSIQIQDAGAGSTVRASVYAMPLVSPSTISTTVSSPPSPSSTTTYVSVFDGLAAPNGQFFELVGAANVVVRVKDVYFFKPSVSVGLKALLQSVASMGGTSSTVATKLDLNDVAAAGTAKQYTVAPAAGTSAGNLISVKSVTSGDTVGFTQGDNWDGPVVIRSGQSMALSVDAAATVYGYVKWTESAS